MAEMFKDLDFYQLDELLGPEEKMTRDAVTAVRPARILPEVESAFRRRTFPIELVSRMAELGIFGANLKGYGCAGMNNIAYGLIMQELEAGDSDCGRSPRSRARWRCTRSIRGAPKSRRTIPPRDGQGKLSDASASPNPTTV